MITEEDKYILERCVYDSPLTILNIIDEEKLDYLSKMIPYSTGFEVECDVKESVSYQVFNNIPFLIENKSGHSELRFRIPSGIRGIICLYCISIALKRYALYNSGSGIHYHIDFTDADYNITPDFIQNNQDWILQELDLWQYRGDYNKRAVTFYKGNWFVFRGRTIEIRCGNMEFEYKKLLKNITHANSIVRKVKSLLIGEVNVNELDNLSTIGKINKEIVLNYLSDSTSVVNKSIELKNNITRIKAELRNINKALSPARYEPTEEDLKKTIKSRIE